MGAGPRRGTKATESPPDPKGRRAKPRLYPIREARARRCRYRQGEHEPWPHSSLNGTGTTITRTRNVNVVARPVAARTSSRRLPPLLHPPLHFFEHSFCLSAPPEKATIAAAASLPLFTLPLRVAPPRFFLARSLCFPPFFLQSCLPALGLLALRVSLGLQPRRFACSLCLTLQRFLLGIQPCRPRCRSRDRSFRCCPPGGTAPAPPHPSRALHAGTPRCPRRAFG